MDSFDLHNLSHWSIQEDHEVIINSELNLDICSTL